ncbi:phospholipase A [uncultured Microbulbifer sp.]|uniref:phospholipase A n=1 Tax=uncultured Microbulbifer sp. TaxID=348147 RepID=UPI0025FEA074|nr:phospholipase A [uncultured Microbulbifer sp.]
MTFGWRKFAAAVLLQIFSATALGEEVVSQSVVAGNVGEGFDAGSAESGALSQMSPPFASGKPDDAQQIVQVSIGKKNSKAEWNSSAKPFVSDRIQAVRDAVDNPFSLASHRENYLLPVAFRNLSEESLVTEERYGMEEVEPAEIQFQLSLQVPIWSGILGEDSFLSFAYTNRSFWQAYAESGPFRETNHEVELLATWASDWQIFGFQNVVSQAGVSHQSNGRGAPYSRGWNRVFVDFTLERGGYFIGLKPWYRLSTDSSAGRGPDLDTHFGNFELSGGYRSGRYTSSFKLRNNLSSENLGAVELSWKFPITTRVRGFVKYFDGYGESLIDYSVRVRTFGVGFELAPGIF